MTTALIIALIALVVASIALIIAVRQLRMGRRLAQQIELLQQQRPKTSETTAVTTGFSAHLSSAEKVQDKTEGRPVAQADKYRYAAALADQGYSAEGIAKALNMAPTEVEQIMRLARIKRTA